MREILDNEQLSENAWSETSPEGYRFDITVAKAYETRTKDLPLKILEIDVTMSWKKGGKEQVPDTEYDEDGKTAGIEENEENP